MCELPLLSVAVKSGAASPTFAAKAETQKKLMINKDDNARRFTGFLLEYESYQRAV